MDDRHDLPPGESQSGEEPPVYGPPPPGRARIAGVEAGVAAGLTPAAPDERHRPGEERVDDETQAISVPLPAWTDPPTREVPRVLLDPSDEPTQAVPGPVWREDESDWDSDSLAFAELVNEGSAVVERRLEPEDDLELPEYTSPRQAQTRTISSNPVPPRRAGEDSPEPEEAPGPGRHRRSGVVWAGRRPRTERPAEPEAGAPRATGEAEMEEGTKGKPAGSPGGSYDSGDRPGERTELLKRTSGMPILDRGRRVGPRVRLLFAGRGHSKVAEESSGPSATAGAEGPFDAAGAEGEAGSKKRNPVIATLTGLAVGGVTLLCFLAGPPAVLGLACVAFMIATAECYQALRRAHYRPAVVLGLIATPAAAVAGYFRGPQGVLLVISAFLLAAFCWFLAGFTKQRRVANLGVTVLGWIWIGGLGSFVGVLLRPSVFGHRHGIAYLLGALEAVVAYDVGGYVFGTLLGEHRLAPTISPNKTWEGLLGGSLCALVVAIAITRLMAPWTLGRAIALGVIVAVVAPLGDLAESMVKRELGLKDMGTLLPAHGGLLDRIDAILFVLPATFYLVLAFHG